MIDTTLCEDWFYHDLTDQQFCAGKEEGSVDACQVSQIAGSTQPFTEKCALLSKRAKGTNLLTTMLFLLVF